MVEFTLSHIKERHRNALSDRGISVHATLAEMLGTGMVVLVGTSAAEFAREALENETLLSQAPFNNPVSGLHGYLLSAVVFGMIYFAVMCSTQHHGGAHLNPAITLASMAAGITPAIQAIAFMTAQVVGAIIASAIVLGLAFDQDRDDSLLGANVYRDRNGLTKSRALGVEILGTFMLVYIYLQTFSHPRSEHRAIAPLAVGLAYTALLTVTAPYSSASLNPARAIGPAAVAGEGSDLWIWIAGPIIGALLAVPMHLLSVTDVPELDPQGNVKRSSSVEVVDSGAAKAMV